MIEFASTIAALCLLGAFLLGQWWGQRTMRQYLEAARAVQTITNESMTVMQRFIEADSRTALTLEAHGRKVDALEARQAILGRGIESVHRDIAALVERDHTFGEMRNGRAPGRRVAVTDGDLT